MREPHEAKKKPFDLGGNRTHDLWIRSTVTLPTEPRGRTEKVGDDLGGESRRRESKGTYDVPLLSLRREVFNSTKPVFISFFSFFSVCGNRTHIYSFSTLGLKLYFTAVFLWLLSEKWG